MKRLVTIALTLTVLLACIAPTAGAEQYGWTLSDSNIDPLSNVGSFVPGLVTLYLWLYCGDGMAAAQFSLFSSHPANLFLATTPQNGFLNAGSAFDLLLAVGGCPAGPVLAAELLVLVNAPGEFCLVPNPSDGVIGTVDCTANPQIWPIQQIGYTHTGIVPTCNDELCPTTAVEEDSWGGVKKLFR